jgi:lipoate-protein ligase A
MDFYFLDLVPWQDSQGLYHSAAHLGREVLFILRPATPYVCLGFHQDAEQEIDLEFAEAQGIPVFRREVGGGAVYLDRDQLFYQLVLRRDHPLVPATKARFYQRFLDPVVRTYRQFGVAAEYRPVNDIVAKERKVSGNGAAEIGEMVVLVGNFILDFDFRMMSKVLRVPDEKFRDKVYKTLRGNLTTIRRETSKVPRTTDLAGALFHRYEALLGPLTPKTLDAGLKAKADQLMAEMNRPEWLFDNDRRRPDLKQVKIREGIYVVQRTLKTPGGLMRATAVHEESRLSEVHLSGDFFFFPAQRLRDLEQALEGVEFRPDVIAATVEQFYQVHAVDSPGVQPQDFAQVLTGAV